MGAKSRWVTNPAAPEAAPTHARPSRKPPLALAAVRSAASRTVNRGRDFRPAMTPLSAFNASEDPGAGRPPRSQRRFSDCAGPAEASRDPVQRASGLLQWLSALRVPHSPEGLQTKPGPTHRARPQPTPQPRVRAAWPVLAFGFVALSCQGTSPETRGTQACEPHRNTGLNWSGEFCPLLWRHSETPLISTSRRTPYCQDPACTAVYGASNKPNFFKRFRRSTQASAESSEFRSLLPLLRCQGYHVLSP